jgi:hypothetical protein
MFKYLMDSVSPKTKQWRKKKSPMTITYIAIYTANKEHNYSLSIRLCKLPGRISRWDIFIIAVHGYNSGYSRRITT